MSAQERLDNAKKVFEYIEKEPEILTMLDNRQVIDAIKKIRFATGLDLKEALQVVNMLRGI